MDATAALQLLLLLLLLPLTLPPFPLLLLPLNPCPCPCCGGSDVAAQHLRLRLSRCLFGQLPFMHQPSFVLVLLFVWAAPICAHQPSFALVLLFVWAGPIHAHQPLFELATTCSFLLPLAGPHACCCSFVLISIRLLVPILV